ncbi:MAG: hypothetical protein V4850_07460 [Myxococcota bacterium]
MLLSSPLLALLGCGPDVADTGTAPLPTLADCTYAYSRDIGLDGVEDETYFATHDGEGRVLHWEQLWWAGEQVWDNVYEGNCRVGFTTAVIEGEHWGVTTASSRCDTQGQLISTVQTHDGWDPDEGETESSVYEASYINTYYPDDRLKLRVTDLDDRWSNDSAISYTWYDADSPLAERLDYDMDGDADWETTYTHDALGDIVTMTHDRGGHLEDRYMTWRRDGARRVVETVDDRGMDGLGQDIQTFHYDGDAAWPDTIDADTNGDGVVDELYDIMVTCP